jgi:hypothetical protein
MTGVIRKFACLSLLAALAACGTAPHDELQTQQAENAAWFAGDFSCKGADGVKVDFATIEKNAAAYTDKCVRTDVFTDGHKLYGSALVMQTDQRAAGVHPRLGVVWKSTDMGHRLHLGPSFVSIVGRVRDCPARLAMRQKGEDIRAQIAHEKPAAITSGGDCPAGTAIFVSDATVVPTAMD